MRVFYFQYPVVRWFVYELQSGYCLKLHLVVWKLIFVYCIAGKFHLFFSMLVHNCCNNFVPFAGLCDWWGRYIGRAAASWIYRSWWPGNLFIFKIKFMSLCIMLHEWLPNGSDFEVKLRLVNSFGTPSGRSILVFITLDSNFCH